MRTVTLQTLSSLTMAFFMMLNIGCKSSSGSSSGGAAEAPLSASIVVTASPSVISGGQTMILTPSGGTAPYTFSLSSGSVGSLSAYTGNFTIYTSPAAGGSASVLISDAAGHSTLYSISAMAGASSLTLSPLNPSVSGSGTVSFSTTGGTGPYTYSVVSGGGSFSSNVFTAPASSQSVTIQVMDSAGHTAQTTVSVGTSSAAGCAGTYNLNLDGTAAILRVGTNDASGNFLGNIQVGTGIAAISGVCASGVISFVNTYSNSHYTGTYVTNANNSGQIVMTGQFVDKFGNHYPWYAVTQ